MSAWVWIGGSVVPAEAAVVSALDRGVLLGDGIFETCKVVDGVPFALTRHLERLRESAQRVGLHLPWSDDDLRDACAETIAVTLGDGGRARGPDSDAMGDVHGLADLAPPNAVGRLRLTVTGGVGPLGPGRPASGPTLLVTTGPGPEWPATADVAIVPWVVNERSPLTGVKSTSHLDYVLAAAAATRAGAHEAVLANSRGVLCEGSSSNVFVVVDGRLCTPSLATGCLAGVTRTLVCESTEVLERDDLDLDHLRSAPEAFLTSSTRDVQPIARVDGRPLRSAPGPLTTAAAVALAALQAQTLDP